jgi:hypothetical protein
LDTRQSFAIGRAFPADLAEKYRAVFDAADHRRLAVAISRIVVMTGGTGDGERIAEVEQMPRDPIAGCPVRGSGSPP